MADDKKTDEALKKKQAHELAERIIANASDKEIEQMAIESIVLQEGKLDQI